MSVLPPGTLLQLMYLRARIRRVPPGHFIEIGPGSGEITQLLLSLGWSGTLYELEAETVAKLQGRFAKELQDRRLEILNSDYLTSGPGQHRADLVISCMVMEHLDADAESAFMRKSADCLKDTGVLIGFVPGSPAHWGIEDDIAGHFRRYTRESIGKLISSTEFIPTHIAGLTYPVSNLLLPLSNYLVNRGEKAKLRLSTLERTKQSGKRRVAFKTYFPSVFGMILNRFTMLPLYGMQKLFTGSKNALVLYFECYRAADAKNN